MEQMQPKEFAPTNDPKAEAYDMNGNPRSLHTMPDGTMVNLSDKEFAEEMEIRNGEQK